MSRISCRLPRALGVKSTSDGMVGLGRAVSSGTGPVPASISIMSAGLLGSVGIPPTAAICRYRPSRNALLRLITATRRSFQRGFVLGCRVQDRRRHGEPEIGSARGGRIDPDLAAHGFHQPFGNGQPQARAAEFARMAGVGLHEFLENLVALGGRHADAGVAHFKAQEGFVATESRCRPRRRRRRVR